MSQPEPAPQNDKSSGRSTICTGCNKIMASYIPPQEEENVEELTEAQLEPLDWKVKLKIFFVVFTLVGGAILAIGLNIFQDALKPGDEIISYITPIVKKVKIEGYFMNEEFATLAFDDGGMEKENGVNFYLSEYTFDKGNSDQYFAYFNNGDLGKRKKGVDCIERKLDEIDDSKYPVPALLLRCHGAQREQSWLLQKTSEVHDLNGVTFDLYKIVANDTNNKCISVKGMNENIMIEDCADHPSQKFWIRSWENPDLPAKFKSV